MSNPLDNRLADLSRLNYEAALGGLEGAVWSALERRKREAITPGVQMGMAAAALALGLALGLGSVAVRPHSSAAELQVLSDDSIAPSSRIGGA
jgi:hypothetical protein